eukprot:TRINITY_DN69858_c0_g1_i1.p1 TRINITY_DN69858_c0_g1~~TRINITY_DN69858_c0_g1_i1.p1  ORF type:complete len:259 (-),score=46.77 TRINITY_DN69858_c0_g1_i1:73-777(-)
MAPKSIAHRSRCRGVVASMAVLMAIALASALGLQGAETFIAGKVSSLLQRPVSDSFMSRRATTEERRKKKKEKQRLSLAEALDREKEARMKAGKVDKREEAKLLKEETFWEGPPSSTEMFAPFLSCFLVIGIIPMISAINRQFRVKYKITSKRVSVTGGWDGTDVTEFSYQEIYEMKYGLRFLGYCGDIRINLRDGAKVEVFGLLNFEDNYNYILSRVDKDARRRSDLPPQFRN